LQWTTPVSKLLPDDFVLPDPQLTKEVTIEDILSHRTGIASHDDSYRGVLARHPDNAKSMTRNLRNLPFAKPLRTGYIYSNIMFTVATHLVETVSGEPYAAFLRRRLWQPLGMTNTFHDLPDVEANNAQDRKATGYRWDKAKKEYIAMPSLPQPEGQGAGCIFSSADDYAKWVRALLKRSPPLSTAAHEALITPRTVVPVAADERVPFYSDPLYTLGLIKKSYRGHTVIGHDGSVPGFNTKISYMPEYDWGIAIFGNSDGALHANQILNHVLMDEVLEVPTAERKDWASFFRSQYGRDEAEDGKEDPEFMGPENPEPLGVPLEKLAGTYYDAGYKDLILEMKDGKLVADCQDRCFPFMLTFEHLTGKKLVVELHDLCGDEKLKMRGEVRIEGGKATSLGIEYGDELKGHPIWFDRVDQIR
jgi:CubicO group peptidase (beta-lactamase class C family)